MRVLVVRVTSMGDVVLTLPAISDMIDRVPGIEIDWLVEKPFAAIAAMHPGENGANRFGRAKLGALLPSFVKDCARPTMTWFWISRAKSQKV
jgi:ADP-heptose:LPS heptosyltransferase